MSKSQILKTAEQIPDPAEIEILLQPLLLRRLPEYAYEQLAKYVRLIYLWNDQINLTAIRDPAVMVGLHIAECIRCAQKIPDTASTVLDFGSGAGLPGIPIQIARPDLVVTLAESQNKKAAFLREAVRELNLGSATVYSGRVEHLPLDQQFDVVALRAVDNMDWALKVTESRIREHGCCMILTSNAHMSAATTILPKMHWTSEIIPATQQRILLVGHQKQQLFHVEQLETPES